MTPYTSTIAAVEHELQGLDVRRAKLVAAIGSLRELAGTPAPAPPVPQAAPLDTAPRAENERTNERTKQARSQNQRAGASLA